MTYQNFQKSLRQGIFKPAYLIAGSEDYLAEAAVEELTSRLLTTDERELNLTVFYGKEAEGLPEALLSPPIFAARRVILIRHAQELPLKTLDHLSAYLKHPPTDACLILWASEVDRKRAFFKRLEGQLESVDCAKLKPADQIRWMEDFLPRLGKTLDKQAQTRILLVNWPGLRELAGELDRLALMVGERKVITVEDIEELGGSSYIFERYKLGNAIATGNLADALSSVENLQAFDTKPTQIVGDLFRLMRQLWFLRYHIDKGQPDEGRKGLALQDFVIKILMSHARRCPIRAFEDAILRLSEAEMSIKRGLRPDALETSLLIADMVKILTPVPAGVKR